MKKLLTALLLIAATGYADPPFSATVDYSYTTVPSFEVYQASQRTGGYSSGGLLSQVYTITFTTQATTNTIEDED